MIMVNSEIGLGIDYQNGYSIDEEQNQQAIDLISSQNIQNVVGSSFSTEEEQPKQQIAEINAVVEHIIKNPLIKKQIAKLYKSQSKKYKKKQMMIIPTFSLVREISQNHLLTLYGCLEVESYYQDYSDPYDHNLILYLERMHQPVSMIKDFKQSVIDVVMSPLSHSGLVDFEFLIDRFIKMQNQNYLEAAKELAVYQYIVKNHYIPNFAKQKNKMLKSTKKKEDFAQAQEEFVKYFKEYTRTQVDPSSFYDYELYRSNYVTGEIELFQSGFSFSLSSLLGVEIDQVENLIFRGQNYFNEQSGEFRLKFFLFIIKAINNEMKCMEPFPYVLRTYDGIVINCQVYLEYVNFAERPSWIDQDEMYGIILRFDVSVNQIKAILEIRSKQNSNDLQAISMSVSSAVEYQTYSEIFIEKFYPELSEQQSEEQDDNSYQNHHADIQKNKNFIRKGLMY